ncbi:ABC transporter permease [Actinomadura chibensis]|uniref:ABC transporter permease n=1 Tax=Actinomadura chibensis TaxID=392828 RepID=A0A5D0NZJ6_9ACTN|nr:ABC transporter permease [Actinomadura chibensis]TYB49772.1 ABC transporter permease [Actinomadura chibensis]
MSSATQAPSPKVRPPEERAARRFAPPPLALFLGTRLLRGVLVMFLLSIIAFGLVHMLPGNSVDLLAGPYSTPETRAQLTRDLGLDGPLIEQYTHWLGNVLRGDFGISVFNGQPVRTLIADRLPNTLELAIAATIVSIAWGVPFGAIAAMKRGRFFDRVARSATFLGLATPVFAFGVALVLFASMVMPSWPTLGWAPFTADPARNVQALILPALALGLPLGSTICRYMRASMLEVYEQDYMRTALATGATRLQATVRHGLRNASGPVVTIAGLQLAGMVGQSILIENVFAIPGIGQLTVTSILQKDYAAAQACILLLGGVFVVMNLVVDLFYPLINPKVGGLR